MFEIDGHRYMYLDNPRYHSVSETLDATISVGYITEMEITRDRLVFLKPEQESLLTSSDRKSLFETLGTLMKQRTLKEGLEIRINQQDVLYVSSVQNDEYHLLLDGVIRVSGSEEVSIDLKSGDVVSGDCVIDKQSMELVLPEIRSILEVA